jgi:uncharacterized protein YkwD
VRAGVLAGLALCAIVVALTMPASAFNSGSNANDYFSESVQDIDENRAALGDKGWAFESAASFTPRLPRDGFDDQLFQLINSYRSDNGLAPAQEYEPLRTHATIWSNRMADVGTDTYLTDKWYREDTSVVCSEVSDVFSVSSAAKNATPQSVLDYWLESHPAAATRLMMPGTIYVGTGTVIENDIEWTTLRLAQGSCPGNPAEQVETPAQEPAAPLDAREEGDSIIFSIGPTSSAQLGYEVQRLDGTLWFLDGKGFTDAGREVALNDLPPGQYRIVVPAQSGQASSVSQEFAID